MDETQDTLKIGAGKQARKDDATAPSRVRPWMIVVAVAIVIGVAGGGALAWQRMRTRVATAPVASPAASPSVTADNSLVQTPQQRVLLLEDPVCKQPVDPAKAQYVLEFGDKAIYFDSMECLNQFKQNPGNYARVTVRVKLTRNDMTAPLPPGGPPEPPTGSDPTSTESLDNTEKGPVGDSPLSLPPEPPPAPGPQPSPETLTDAPNVDEDNPPADVPQTAPNDAPAIGAKKPATDLPTEPADATAPPVSESPADANGFQLPPDMGDSKPPARKPAGRKPPAKPADSDAPPSTEEAPPQ